LAEKHPVVTSAFRQVWRSYVFVRSVILSVC